MIDFFSFPELFGNGNAQDRVRGQKIPQPGPTLDYLGEFYTFPFAQGLLVLTCDADEAFTSENWIVSFVSHDTRAIYSKDCEIAGSHLSGEERRSSWTGLKKCECI